MAQSLYCPIRKSWVTALPEEIIRQTLIQQMTQQLDYPLGNIGVEVSLSQLPHIDPGTQPPKRRADLIVFAKNLHPNHSLYPLLLVECKAVPLTQKTVRQIVGYNHFVKAHFIAVINQTSCYLGWYSPEKKDFCFQEGLLSYEELLRKCQTALIPVKK